MIGLQSLYPEQTVQIKTIPAPTIRRTSLGCRSKSQIYCSAPATLLLRHPGPTRSPLLTSVLVSRARCTHLLRECDPEAGMYVIYVDDSGQTASPRLDMGELVAIGGVIVPESAIAGYASALVTLRKDLGIPDGEEIKWKPARNSFLAKAGGELVGQLRQGMLEAAADSRIESVVVVWDRGRVGWTKEEIGPEILKYLYERVTLFLSQRNDVGMIVADEPGGGSKAEKEWLAATLGLTNEGTRYATPDRIVSPILTAPSHHVPHLQLADLVTAATTAAIAGLPKGLELAPLLKKIARTNAYGKVGGAGIVLWPPDLNDLYYWVFGEEFYVRAGEPHPLGPPKDDDLFSPLGRPYMYDDGLSTFTGDAASAT
jgi:hypothetical protein